MYLRSFVLSYIATFHLFHVSSAITSSDDRFVKKYAMMKVYESCYGPEVLKEVRKEMKAASAKCSSFIMPSTPTYATSTNSFKVSPHHSASSHYHAKPSSATLPEEKTTPSISNNIDVAKLQQLILAGYKNVGSQQQQHQQQQQQQQSQLQSQLSQHSHLQSSQQQTPYNSALQQQQANSALQQQQANSALQQSASGLQGNQGLTSLSSQNANILQQVAAAAALSQLPAANQNQLRPYFSAYNNPVASALGSMFYPGSIFGGQSLNPFFSAAAGASQINPYTAALYGNFGLNPFFPGRSSRDMSLRELDGLSRMTGKVKNVTCVMQELGYLDSNLEPDYTRMVERINRLPVSEDLKRDMTDGVEYCRQFSSCVPDERNDKIAKEMIRPMFFFRCYKHKKLESCIMKDIRERYTMAEDLSDDTFGSNSINAEMRTYSSAGSHGRKRKTRRNNKNKKFDEEINAKEDEAMSSMMFNFLYGGEEIELDSLL